MSIASNAGAESAASEILALVERAIADHQEQEAVVLVLNGIARRCREIITSAKDGWY